MQGSSGLAMPRIGRFFKLNLADKVFLLHCLFVVAAVRLGLSLFSYNTLRRWLAMSIGPTTANEGVARRMGWGIDAAASLVPGATCLTKAFAAQWLLARAGYQSQVRIGVAKDAQGQFVAHAWLVSDGQVVVGGSSEDLQRYVSLTDLSLGPP
jgi:Transglutaminase-like superfamily